MWQMCEHVCLSDVVRDEAAVLKAMDDKTGEVLGNTAFFRNKTVDEDQFAKVFFAGFRAFYELSKSTIRVFLFISKQLRPNNDEFLFFIEDCAEDTQLAHSTIYKAIGELCKANIIARGRSDEQYYINPMVVFNGDRVTFATTYIRKNYHREDVRANNVKNTIKSLCDEGQLQLSFEEDEHQAD